MTTEYIIERFENDDLVAGSAKYVGSDHSKAVEILKADRETGCDYRLRHIHII